MHSFEDGLKPPPASPDSSDRLLRLAVVATPRSGNTWLRHLLTSLYDLDTIVIDRPEELGDDLPERCIIQLHWPPEPNLLGLFRRHGVQPLTIYRHPCDVLISILHFCTTWPSTSLWCGGQGGDESSIVGCLPAGREFLEYATGPRARVLLQVSAAWHRDEHALSVSYEKLVDDPVGELKRLASHLHPASDDGVQAAVEKNSLGHLQSLVHNQHYWRGQPGAWKTLLPLETFQHTAAALNDIFVATGYSTQWDAGDEPPVAAAVSDRNWFAMEIMTLRQELSRTREQLKLVRDKTVRHALEAGHLRKRLELQRHDLNKLQAFAKSLQGISSSALETARDMDRMSRRHPKVYATMLRCLQPLLKRAG